MKTIMLALAALTIAAGPSFAGEGNGEPFPFRTPGWTTYTSQQTADVGSEAYPNVAGRPGTRSMTATADQVLQSGSEASVQTANSLPVGAAQGSTALVQLNPARPGHSATLAYSASPRN